MLWPPRNREKAGTDRSDAAGLVVAEVVYDARRRSSMIGGSRMRRTRGRQLTYSERCCRSRGSDCIASRIACLHLGRHNHSSCTISPTPLPAPESRMLGMVSSTIMRVPSDLHRTSRQQFVELAIDHRVWNRVLGFAATRSGIRLGDGCDAGGRVVIPTRRLSGTVLAPLKARVGSR